MERGKHGRLGVASCRWNLQAAQEDSRVAACPRPYFARVFLRFRGVHLASGEPPKARNSDAR